MKTRFILLIVFTLLFALLITRRIVKAQGSPGGEPVEADTNSAFTYQGQVLQNNQPMNGACDFLFSLWDTANSGNQIGSLQTIGNVPITNGLFTVTLNFGVVFDGSPRWLEMAVSCPTGGAFTPVTPRQELTAIPYT